MIIFNTKLVCTNPQKLRQKLCTQRWNCQKTVQSTTTPNLHAIIITTTAEIRSSTSTSPPGHKWYQNGNRFGQWREWGGRQWVSNKLFLRKEKHDKYEKTLSFVEGETRERWEEPMFAKGLRQETSEPASQRGRLEGSVKKLQAQAGRVLHGQELRQGGAAGSDGCKAVRRRRTLKPHTSFSNRTLFVPFVPFSQQKKSQQWLSSPFDSTP
jgi:hypothetical protein